MNDDTWFSVTGARLSTRVIMLPLTYVGEQPLTGAEAWVSG